MLKYILFVSIILKLTLAESEDDEELATVELNMETLSELSAYIDAYDDEISAEMVKVCKQIKKRKACLQAFSKAPVGINTGRRGNDSPGECMYFKRKNNKVVQALGNQCLPANEVKKFVQANGRVEDEEELDDDDVDAVEMSEGLFDKISANAPSQDNIDEEMMKYCKQIKTENKCLRSVSRAQIGRTTNRRGNDGPGECMYFPRRKSKVVQALGNQCLAPQSVINYKQNIPLVIEALVDESANDEESATVELNMETFSDLSAYIDTYDDEISAEMAKTCKQIRKKNECINAFTKAPVGINTGRRGNDSPGECMYFKLKNNPIVKALGNKCLPPLEVKKYIQANRPIYSVQGEDEEEDDADAVEMSEGLFDKISANAPSQDNIDEELMKYCKHIRSENKCLRSVSRAPIGRTTNRRGNDGPGECMYFKRSKNPVVQALGNQCLAPQSVINYKQNPLLAVAALADESEDDEDDMNSVEISMQTWDTLSLYINDADISADARTLVGCKRITSRRECVNKGISRAQNGIITGRRGNENPGECMYFNRRNNPIVQYYKSRCLAPKAVREYKQNPPKYQISAYNIDDDYYNEDGLDSLEIDSIEMSEGLYDVLSKYAPDEDDMELIDADAVRQIIGCKTIRTKGKCINRGVTPNAPNGIDTGRRGNDSPGECMYFNKRDNPVVQALGSKCLAPKAVKTYKRGQPPLDPEDDTEGLPTVELTMNTFYDLAPYITDYNDEISAEMVKVCKQIKKKKACLQAYSKAPIGINTGRRGNDSPGECMYFQRRNNKVVQALGNQCLPANEVKNYVQATPRGEDEEELDDDEENDAVEMTEGLFGIISDNAPVTTSSDDIDQEAIMKYCKQIKTANKCLRSVSRAPIGRTTNRRGNDGPGECMYFTRLNNPVVQALGNRCLAPQSVINYIQNTPPITMENEFFAALGLIDEESLEINYSALSMVFFMMVIIGFGAYYKLCKDNNDKYESINGGNDGVYRYQSV